MLQHEGFFHDDVGAGSAEVSGGAVARAGAAEELDLYGDGEVLVECHSFGGR